MLKKIALGLVALIAVLAVVTALQPPSYAVSRSATLAAPPAAVYAQVADFHRWDAWSPWARLDPGMKVAFSGEPGAVGSTYSWTGNAKVGEGRMTVLEAKPAERVLLKLEFIKPFASTSDTTFTFTPAGPGTTVTWRMEGQLGFLEKAMCLVTDMDKMIGPDFERGLAQLKTVAVAQQATAVPAVAR